jgi:hypothetical protein
MIIVIEIAAVSGYRATKEYDVPSMRSAIAAAERELRAYPQFQITDVWKKDDPPMRLDVGETEDW